MTVSDTDDPATTPDSQKHKFRFNSNDQYHPAITDIVEADFLTGNSGDWVSSPSGANRATALINRLSADYGSGYIVSYAEYSRDNFPNWRYDCPLVTWKSKDIDGYQINGIVLDYPFGGTNTQGLRGGVRIAGDPNRGGFGMYVTGTSQSASPQNNHAFTLIKTQVPAQGVAYYETSAVVWDLPGDTTTPLEDAPQSGNQDAIVIDETRFDIAKPGYNVFTATDAQMAFSASRPFGGIIAADDILCPANTTTEYTLPVSVDATTVADAQFYSNAAEYYYPAMPDATLTGGRYTVSGNKLIIENLGAECRARFMVHAKDKLSSSTGTNTPLNQFTDANGKEVIQLLRPNTNGSRFADIYFDSRWPQIQLLARGIINVGTGELTHVVNFDNNGFLPFVHMSPILEQDGHESARAPIVKVLRIDGRQAGSSTYAKINAAGDEVTFYTHVGNPGSSRFLGNNQSAQYTETAEVSTISKIVYYIFGIPK